MKLVLQRLSNVSAWLPMGTSEKCYGLFVPFFLLVLVLQTAAVCIFPAALQNANYTSSNFGLLEFQVSSLDHAEDGVTSWTCFLNSGNKYVIKSNQTIESFGQQAHFYYCLELTQQTGYSFSYYLLSTLDHGKRRKTFPNGTEATVDSVCDDTPNVAEFNVMVNRAAPQSGRTYCATPLLADFQYTFKDLATNMEQCGTALPGEGLLGVCTNLTRNTLTFNYTACAEQVGYSTGGVLYCVAYTTSTSGSTTTYYQSLYNADSNAVTQFACMAISSGTDANGTDRVYVSQTMNSCSASQNSTTTPDSSGDTLVLTATETCPLVEEDEEEVNVGLIVGLTILGIVLLAAIAALLFYFCYWKKRDPNAGKPIVENTKPRFEDPDAEEVVDDVIDMEDNASTIVTREDITFEARSPSLLPNGKPVGIPNGTPAGSQNKDSYVTFNGGLQNGSLRRDSGIAMTEKSNERPFPRINPSKEAMVIFNGDEKVISGNDSRIIPTENPSARTFRLMNTSGDSGGGMLSLEALEENEAGDQLGELSARDYPYPSLPREKSNLMPPIETVDPENDKDD